MSTYRSKSKSRNRNRPNEGTRERRLHVQPIQGRYPVLPPIGHSWLQGMQAPYHPTGSLSPAMAYLMQPFQQVMPYSYMPPSAIPMNMLFPTQPYYYAPAWPVYQWTESDGSITELPPGDYPHRESDLRQDGGSLTMQQMLMYYDPMLLLKICEDVCSEIVESVVTELAKEAVTACIDEMVKSYLGHARLLSASSMERPKPKPEEVRPSTNPPVNSHQQQHLSAYRYKEKRQLLLQPLATNTQQVKRIAGSGRSTKQTKTEHKLECLTNEVAERICLLLLDELLFQQLLEVAIMGSVRKTSEALAGSILNELLFEECLKIALQR